MGDMAINKGTLSMFRLDTPVRKLAIGALAAATLTGSLAVTTIGAEAGWRGRHHHHHRGVGPGVAAGIIGGLALGALAARPYYAPPRFAARCWTEPRRVVGRHGHVFWQRVRVCD